MQPTYRQNRLDENATETDWIIGYYLCAHTSSFDSILAVFQIFTKHEMELIPTYKFFVILEKFEIFFCKTETCAIMQSVGKKRLNFNVNWFRFYCTFS